MNNDIDPERRFSNGTDWENSVDCDDASDGSDGGYDRHCRPINSNAMKELIQLRMDNAQLREALKPFARALASYDNEMPDDRLTPSMFTYGEQRAARKALGDGECPPSAT